MRVLICTNDTTFNVSLAATYRARGHQVHVSEAEFFLRQQPFDLIHFHWPEELTAWRAPPSPTLARKVLDGMAWWRERAKLVCTVHNLLPHSVTPDDQQTPAYYSAFYGHMDRIGHFSQTSRDAVLTRFPELADSTHIIHGMNLFEDLRRVSTGREAARAGLGIADDAFLMLTMGSLRSWSELALVMGAVDQAKLPNKHILFAARGGMAHNRIKQRLQKWRINRWEARHKVTRFGGILSDSEMVAALEAADALLIPRPASQLNSGLLPAAMTFGTPVVGPNHGVFREMLGGSSNGLYDAGDPANMARAIERVAAHGSTAVRAENLVLASNWGWSHALDKLLSGLE